VVSPYSATSTSCLPARPAPVVMAGVFAGLQLLMLWSSSALPGLTPAHRHMVVSAGSYQQIAEALSDPSHRHTAGESHHHQPVPGDQVGPQVVSIPSVSAWASLTVFVVLVDLASKPLNGIQDTARVLWPYCPPVCWSPAWIGKTPNPPPRLAA